MSLLHNSININYNSIAIDGYNYKSFVLKEYYIGRAYSYEFVPRHVVPRIDVALAKKKNQTNKTPAYVNWYYCEIVITYSFK